MSYKSDCASKDCGAANPIVVNIASDKLPNKVIEKLKEKGLDREMLRKCTYCGNIWIEKFVVGRPGDPTIIWVGIDNSVGGKGMVWKILENK